MHTTQPDTARHTTTPNITTMTDTNVTVAVDIDGCLNPNRAAPGYTTAHITFPTIEKPSWFMNPTVSEASFDILTPPADIVTRINNLDANVAWCTTRDHLANSLYGPAAGIRQLDVFELAGIPPRWSYIKNGDIGAFKYFEVLTAHAPTGPLVWIDDLAHPYLYNDIHRNGPTLLICCDPDIGLTHQHLDDIDTFINQHS